MKPLRCNSCNIDVLYLPANQPGCPSCAGALVELTTQKPTPAIQKAPKPNVPAPVITRILPRLEFKMPMSVVEMFSGGASEAGYSAVSTFMGCPERSRLKSLKVQRRVNEEYADVISPLNALGYGLLIHALLANRVLRGQHHTLEVLKAMAGLHPEDRVKGYHAMMIYDEEFPLDAEPFEYVGIETEVRSDVGDGKGGPCIRTVRYDGLIRYPDGSLFGLERKTQRSLSSLVSYTPQFWTQVALWNANPFLVEKYGPMRGVITDAISKTVVPKVERAGPIYVSELQEQRIIEYLRLPDSVKFEVGADGSYPRFMHTCWGKYGPCEYIGLCHDAEYGSYEVPSTAPAVANGENQ